MRPRAALSKNRLMKGQIFRKFQWFCWFFSKMTISRESWRAAEKSFKGRMRPAGRGLADADLHKLHKNSRNQGTKSVKHVKIILNLELYLFAIIKKLLEFITMKKHWSKCKLMNSLDCRIWNNSRFLERWIKSPLFASRGLHGKP